MYVLIALSFVIGITLGSSLNVVADSPTIPSWVKKTALWWGQGQITDGDFIKALQYLISQGILVVPQTTQQSTTTLQGYQTYTNDVYKFSIQYPQDWSMKEAVNGKVDIGSSSQQFTAIVVFAPSSQTNDNYITNVNVKTISGVSGVSLDDLQTQTISSLQDFFASNDFKEISSGKMKVSDKDAFYIEYIININGVIAETKQVIIPNGDDAFIVTYGSPQNTFNNSLNQFDTSISTFKLT